MSKQCDVIVIGGGHNGLVCATKLAQSGRRVLVLEAAAEPGGGARTRTIADGFSISACAHLVYQLNSAVSEELRLPGHGLKFAAMDLGTVALGEEGEHLQLRPRHVEGAVISQKDQAAYGAFMGKLCRFAGVLGLVYDRTPPRLVNGTLRDNLLLARLGWSVRRLGRDDMRELLRIGAINIYDVLQEEFDNELLKGVLSFDAVLGTQLGPRSPNTVLTLLHRLTGQVGRTDSAVAIVAGGMGTLTTALTGAAAAAGVEIRCNAPVARINVAADAVTGVELADGESLTAALVVSNADPKTTFLELVGARYLEAGFVRRVSNIRMHGCAAKLHLALDGLPEFSNLDSRQLANRLLIAPSMTYVERAFNHCKYGEYSPAPALEITIPSIVDPGLAPAGKHVLSAVVQYAPYRLRQGWDGGRQDFLDLAIDRMETFAPGLREQIIASELLAPIDIEREFRMGGGHWHHGEFTLDQFLMLRPVPGAAQYATPLQGLYLCGAGAHPGGGIMGLAGRNAANEIVKREKAA